MFVFVFNIENEAHEHRLDKVGRVTDSPFHIHLFDDTETFVSLVYVFLYRFSFVHKNITKRNRNHHACAKPVRLIGPRIGKVMC